MNSPIAQPRKKLKRRSGQRCVFRYDTPKTCMVLVLLLWVGAGVSCSNNPQGVAENAWISDLVAAENLILKLTIRLDAFNDSDGQLSFPDRAAKSLFAESISVVDIDDKTDVLESYGSLKTQVLELGR